MSEIHALLITGGPFPSTTLPLPKADLIIAADQGGDHAQELNLVIDLLIGDFDSCSLETIKNAKKKRQYPTDKDVTDLELALMAALEVGATSVTILTSVRGRFDHSLGNLLIAASSKWKNLKIELIADNNRIKIIRNTEKIFGEPGDLLTLFSIGGTAFGVSSKGLKWELEGNDLVSGTGLGISNKLITREAEISIEKGVLISIQ